MTIRGVLCVLTVLGVSFIDAQPARAQPTNWLVRAASAAREQLSTNRPRIARRSIELENASLETLKNRLGWFGINIPLELNGDVTARLVVEVDLSSLNDASAYRINGSLSSKQLTVEGLTLQNFAATARYVDGTLTLQQLVATVPDPRRGEPSGRIDGEATMRLIPVGALTASLRLESVPLEQVRRRIEALSALHGGRLTGRLNAEAPVATVRDVTTWRGSGQLELVELKAAGRDFARVATDLRLEGGTLALNETTATIEGERLTGSGSLGLTPPFDFEIVTKVPSGDLSRLGGVLGQSLPADWSGQYAVTAKAAGTLRPFQISGTAHVSGQDWLVADIPVDRFSATAGTDGATLKLTQLVAKAADGDWSGTAAVGLKTPFKYESTLAVESLQLAQLESLAREFDARLQLGGTATGRFESSGTLSPQEINASGELAIRDFRLNGQTFSSATLRGTFSPNAVDLKLLELVSADSRVTGTGRFELTGTRSFALHFTPQGFDLATLEPVVSVALRDESPAKHAVAFRSVQETDQADGSATPNGSDIPPAIGGTATGEIDVTGSLLPFKLDALDGSLVIDDLNVGGVVFNRAEIEATTIDDTIELSRVLLTKGTGRIEGAGSLGLNAPGEFSASMRVSDFVIDDESPLFGSQTFLPARLPPVSGALAGDVSVSGETQPFRLTSAQGTLTGDEIEIGRLRVDRFEIAAATADDVVNVNNFVVVVAEGRLTGNASVGLKGRQAFEATLRPQSFRIELLKPLFGEGGLIETDFPPIAGRLTGELTVKGRLAPMGMEAVSGTLRSSEEGNVSGVRFQQAAIVVASENGIADISEFSAVSEFGSLRGTGSVGLSPPYRYSADISFRDFNLSAIGDLTAAITEEQRSDIDTPAEVAPDPGVLPIELEGLANVAGSIDGTLIPFVLTGDGQGGADRLVLNANELSTLFRRTTLTAPSFHWHYNERLLTLETIAAGLGGGMLSGATSVPLGDAVGGALDLKLTDVALADVFELPGQLDGVASVEIAATISAVGDDGERSANGTASIEIPVLQAGRAAAGDVEALLSFNGDVFDYDVQGSLFGGPVAANGTVSFEPGDHDRSTGHFEWTAGNLSRVAAVFSDEVSLAGRIDAHIDHDFSAATKATGTIELTDVRNGTTLLTDRFDARLSWTDSELRIENVAGTYAGGSVSLAARLNPLDVARGTVEVLLRRADAARAVDWIPGLEPLEGTLDMRLRGRLGDLQRWQGEAELGRGSYGPLAFSAARVPLAIDINPLRGALHVESHRASLRAAHGRGIMNMSVDLGFVRRLDIDATFTNLDAAEVLDGDGLGSRLSGGRISGTMQLSSRNFRTINDLDGSLVASLTGSRAQNLPVIGSVFDVARLPTGGGGTIERGDIRVFIGRGVARIEEVALAGRSFRLYAEGTVALESQRLALDVVVDTSPSRSDRFIAAFLLRQFVTYATPIGWLDQANRFISERAIYLRVTGTVDRPVVRIRPFEQLGQEGVRFFLNEIATPLRESPSVAPR